MILIDLDNFKGFNDTHGHSLGDLLLVAFVRRVATMVREIDLFARLGGDEFAVLLTGLHGSLGADAFAGRLWERLASPLLVGEEWYQPRASAGIATWPESGVDASALLRHADEALYSAKRQGGGSHARYEQGSVTTARPTA